MEMVPHIKRLPDHLIDQIKAGEVIEQPASILKELIENSLDAGATNIKIHIENNGLDLISVEDNGHGMTYDDLPLAFGRHATSKLNKFEDLYKLSSFGFRGEALASMASISRLTCISTPANGKGGKLILHGGKLISHVEFENESSGTTINIQDLFFNTPVRLKFIKSKISEKNAIWKTLNSFILSNPNISISIKVGSEDRLIFKEVGTVKERVKQVFKKNKKLDVDNFINVRGEYEGHSIIGMVGPKGSRGSSKNTQFLFANKRIFSDKALHSAVVKAMEGVWNPGESGPYCLILDVPKNYIDVNIHPRKTEIKFFKPSVVFSLVQSSIERNKPKREFTLDPIEAGDLSTLMSENDSMVNNWASEVLPSRSLELIKITDSFFLYQLENRPYLINLDALYQDYIDTVFKPVEENETTPLLIAEPFILSSKTIDTWFSTLKSFGFALERSDENRVLMRSVPSYLSELPARLLLGNILNNLEKNPNLDLKSHFKHEDNIKKINFSLQQVQIMLKPFLSNWDHYAFYRPLSNEVLNRIYQ